MIFMWSGLGETLRDFKGKLYQSPARVLLRRMGVGRALALSGFVRSLYYIIRFRLSRRDTAEASIGAIDALFPVSNPREMQHIETLGGERKLLHRLIREIRSGDVVFDVGANIGLWTVLMAKAVGEKGLVVSFEPESNAYRRLQQNIDTNCLKNVKLFDRALGNQARKADLFVDNCVESGVHNLRGYEDNRVGWSVQSVEMVVGDQFIAEQALPVPHVVKIDVEGAEYEVLLGLFETLCHPECRLICCEVHFSVLESVDQEDVPAKIDKSLREAGFRRIEWVDYSHLLAFKGLGE